MEYNNSAKRGGVSKWIVYGKGLSKGSVLKRNGAYFVSEGLCTNDRVSKGECVEKGGACRTMEYSIGNKRSVGQW